MRLQLAEDVLVVDGPSMLQAGHDTAWFFDEMGRLDRAHRAAGDKRPIRVLVDVRGVPAGAAPSRRVVYARHRELAHHRIAVLGNSPLQEFMTNFLIAATGHRNAHYFTDEARARAWLAEAPR